MREDGLVRSLVKAWREVVRPRPSDAECWRLDRMLRDELGGRRFYVLKNATVERERASKSK